MVVEVVVCAPTISVKKMSIKYTLIKILQSNLIKLEIVQIFYYIAQNLYFDFTLIC